MAQYDLTPVIATYLDRHMVIHMLDFLQEKQLFPDRDILKANLDVVAGTKMLGLEEEQYKKLNQPVPADLEKRKQQIYTELKEWKEECKPLLDALEQKDVARKLKEKEITLADLKEQYNVTDDHVNKLYRYAKLTYDCGGYPKAADYLLYFRLLCKDEEQSFWALWGKLAADILSGDWELAIEDWNLLREAIDGRIKVSAAEQLLQRTWLLHWGLPIFFNLAERRNMMIECFRQERLINAIQTKCPHILRYLTAAVVEDKKRKGGYIDKDLIRILKMERTNYTDPVIELVMNLTVDFDFEAAHKNLKLCEQLLTHDFFLSLAKDEFMDAARHLMFDVYCRVHKSIDLSTLARTLDLPSEDKTSSEQKIVEFVRNAGVAAKIDLQNNQLVMESRYPTVYEQVVFKTKDLPSRTAHLMGQVEKKYQMLLEGE